MSKILKPLIAATVLAAIALPLMPAAPAQAQWVFVARKALGRIHQMTEGQQQGGQSKDVFSVKHGGLPEVAV